MHGANFLNVSPRPILSGVLAQGAYVEIASIFLGGEQMLVVSSDALKTRGGVIFKIKERLINGSANAIALA